MNRDQTHTHLFEQEPTFELPEIQSQDDTSDLASLVEPVVVDSGADEPPPDPPLIDVRPRRRSRAPFAAAVATLLLGGAVVVTLTRGAGAEPSAASAPELATSSVASSVAPDDDPDTSVPTLDPLPDDASEPGPFPAVEDEPLPPPDPQLPDLPPPGPPSNGASLSVTSHYQLDPGVDAVSIALANDGEADLHFEIANDGDGFDATVNESGTIEPGGVADVWIELEVTAEGEGPTPFSRIVEVESDGGDATVTIDGQVEKPGVLVAEFESIPLVDYRATLRFTNLGGLPIELSAVDAPGLTLAPLPDAVAAGETLELEVAICDDGAPPVFFTTPIPANPLPMFHFASWVTLETPAGTATTSVAGTSIGFFPPSCDPVEPGPGDLQIAIDG